MCCELISCGAAHANISVDRIKAFALVEVDSREARSEEFSKKEFEEIVSVPTLLSVLRLSHAVIMLDN